MHVNGAALIIDDSSHVVCFVGVKDSITMGDTEVQHFSRMVNPGNLFKPMLLTVFFEDDSVCHDLSELKYSCGYLSLASGQKVVDHRNSIGIDEQKINLKEALATGSNVAFYDFFRTAYPDEHSRVHLSVETDKLLPKEIPMHGNGLPYQNESDLLKLTIGFGVAIQPYSLAFFYHALAHQGRFRLVNDDCTYRHQAICSDQTAEKVINLLESESTSRIGIHGTMMDSSCCYPSYVGYTPNFKFTVMIILENSGNTAVAGRVFDRIIEQLKKY